MPKKFSTFVSNNYEYMKTIDLRQLVERSGKDRKEIAEELFPGNKFPVLALKRVMAGHAVLDANQISRLALYLGVPIETLFTGDWKGGRSEGNNVTFEKGNWRAEYDRVTGITRIFHRDTIYHEEVLHTSAVPLREYIEALDNLIKKY